jgi:hypothetical protein
MTTANVFNLLRAEDFDFNLAKKDNLDFASSTLQEAGAHMEAAAVDEAEALYAFGQTDSVSDAIDQELGTLPHHEKSKCGLLHWCPPHTPVYSAVDTFAPVTIGLEKYLGELSNSGDKRTVIVSDFTDTNTLSNTPLVYLTYDNPPAPAPDPAPLPPGPARNLDGGPGLREIPIPPITHDFQPAPAAENPPPPAELAPLIPPQTPAPPPTAAGPVRKEFV